MSIDHMAEDPASLSDQQLLEVCLDIPSASVVGIRYHLEQKRREKRSFKLLIWLSFWAACAATASLMLTIAMLITKIA